MQNTSTAYKTKIKEASRQFQCRITIGDKIFTNENIVDVKIDGNMQPQDSFMIGVTPSTTLDLTLLNKGDTIYSTNQIKVELGLNTGSTIEYILMGYYNIDYITKTDYTIKFTAFDNMIKFETPYFSDLGENATLQQIVNELASKTGVQFTGSLPSYTVKKLEGFTCREVLGYVASLCGGNALINREGKFTIVVPKDINYSIDTNNYFDYKREEVKYKIGKVSCKVGDKELVKGSLGVDSMELQFENPWVTESILTDIYTKLNGFNYLGYSMKWQGDISLDLGDIVTITDKKGVVRKHPILSQKFNYTGGLTVEMGAKGESKNKNSFNSSGENSKKINRVVTELALVNKAFVDYARINDAEIVSLKAKDAEINNALIYKANIKDLDVINGKIQNLIAEDAKINNALINKADIIQLNAVSAKINVLEADSATIKTLLAGNITAENIQSNFLQVLQGWMLEGSIGNAQISDLNANKIRSGTVDTSLVTVAGPGGRLQLRGNKLQVFDNKNGTLYERIMLGIDSNNNSSLTLRGADGTTVLLTQDGLTKAGFTDGYNKIDNGSLDGIKLDINSVIRSVNGATEKIESTVVNVGNKTLNVLLQEQTNTITEHGTSLATQEARITANEKAINLKVDTQTYTTDKTTINNSIATTFRDSKAYADTKKSEAISTAATDATTKANAAKDSAVSTAASDATTKANSAKDTAIAEAQKKADKALADSKLYVNQEITTVNSNLSKATSDISVLKGKIALKVEQSDIDKTVTTVKNELVTKIDGIEIGVRNLVKGTSDNWNNYSGVDGCPYYYSFDTDFKLSTGIYTISWEYEYISGYELTINVGCGISATSAFSRDIAYGGSMKATNSFTFEVKDSHIADGKLYFGYRFRMEKKAHSCKIRKIKLEKGNKATDWTPAPEDTDQAIADVITTTDTKISQAKADIKIETDKIALNVSNLTTKTSTIETQLGDKATKAEVKTVSDKAATIEANLNGITQRVSSTESNISTVTSTVDNLKAPHGLAYTRDIILKGNSNKYYPVYIRGGDQNILRTIKIWRGYSEKGPDDWNSPTHKGSLMLTWQGNFGGWGGAVYREFLLENSSQYTTLLADCSLEVHSMAYCFMLRGGGVDGAIYHFASDQVLNIESYYNGANDIVFNNSDPNYVVRAKEAITTVNAERLNNLKIAKEGSVSAVDVKINQTNTKLAEIKTTTDGISQRVSSTESTIATHTTQLGAVDGKINTAKSDAISTAAIDASSKANSAKTDAISAASTDATTKANKALSDGKTYTDTGLKPVKDTLATHTTEISSTKQQVSTIETNLGSITSRVSTVENKTTTIDGKVAAQETRLQSAENKITPTSIVNSVNEALSGSSSSISTTSTTLSKNSFEVRNAAFKLYDTYGDLALSSGNGWTYAQGGLQAAVAPHNKPNIRGVTLSSGNSGLKPYGITHESFNNLPFIIGSNNLKVDIRNMIDTEWGNLEAKSIFSNDVYSNHAEGNYSQLIRNELNSRGGDGILWLNYLTDSVSTSQVVIGAGDMGNWGKISANSLYVKGSKNCIQETENYGYRAINAYETADYYFGDIGEGTIGEDGLCYVSIDDVFMEVVNTKCNYQVFLTKYGKGDIWVKERTENYFVVEGTPGLLFGGEIKAKRKGYETDRLEIADITPKVSMDFRLSKEDESTLNMDKRTYETLTIMNNSVKEESKEQSSILNSMDEEVRQKEMEREQILEEW